MIETCGKKHLHEDEHTDSCRTDLAPVDPSTLPSCAPDNPLEALSWLGDTVEEVAEGLRARGIKGKRSRAGECPLACYLTTWWHQAHVWRSYGVADENGVWGEIRLTPVRLFEFVQQFDNGSFPDLIDNG